MKGITGMADVASGPGALVLARAEARSVLEEEAGERIARVPSDQLPVLVDFLRNLEAMNGGEVGGAACVSVPGGVRVPASDGVAREVPERGQWAEALPGAVWCCLTARLQIVVDLLGSGRPEADVFWAIAQELAVEPGEVQTPIDVPARLNSIRNAVVGDWNDPVDRVEKAVLSVRGAGCSASRAILDLSKQLPISDSAAFARCEDLQESRTRGFAKNYTPDELDTLMFRARVTVDVGALGVDDLREVDALLGRLARGKR